MDIEALLLSSNQEAADELEDAYDDVFEEEDTTNNNSNNDAEKAAVLMAAAKTVAIEEKRLADKVFNETAEAIVEDMKPLSVKEAEAQAILVDASKEVNDHYNENADEEEAKKFASIAEEEEEDVKSSSDDEDESRESEEDDEHKSLNQSLFFACHNEKIEGTRVALKKGADYYACDRHGWTPLIWAASKGNLDIMEILLNHVRSRGKSVKRYVNTQDSITGWTALHVTAVGGHLEAAEFLLRNRAKTSIRSFLDEVPADCVGKGESAKELRHILTPASAKKNGSVRASRQVDQSAAHESKE